MLFHIKNQNKKKIYKSNKNFEQTIRFEIKFNYKNNVQLKNEKKKSIYFFYMYKRYIYKIII